LCTNNAEVLRDAAARGCGIAVVPVFIAEKELKNGALRSILPDYHPPALSLYALYSQTRHLAVKVRLFIDFLVGQLK
jgi:DNA-binding transcriptional LysR family regulator